MKINKLENRYFLTKVIARAHETSYIRERLIIYIPLCCT